MKCIIPVMSTGSMSYVLSHLSYILILPSPVLLKEKEKWFSLTNVFCCYNSVYLGLYAENCLGALRLWGFCSQTPPSLAKLPQPPTLGSADHLTEDSCRDCESQKILIHFCFYFSTTHLFFSLDLMGLLQNPKLSTPCAHNHKASAVGVTTGLWGHTHVPSNLVCPKGFSPVWMFQL